MSHHTARIAWSRNDGDFPARRYSREHTWTFDGGLTVPASASPSNVPLPFSNPALVDPEEAFVAAISSCHMLWFLALAAEQGFIVEHYIDDAVGVLVHERGGKSWISTVTLVPRITYGGTRHPSDHEEDELHHLAHDKCFIANSVRTVITVQRPA